MPPTALNGAQPPTEQQVPPSNAQRAVRPADKKSDIVVRVKYGNALPDMPFDLKYLQYPFSSDRYLQYNPTSLERNNKYEVLVEHDLGVTIDLINRELYQADPNAILDAADEKLLEEDVHTPHDSLRSKQHSRSVSWLRKSEYISTEQTRFQPQNLENIEAKVGYNVKKSLREETLYLDREAQIKAIEKTFTDSKQEITKHYSKSNVVPVEILPVYPDFKNWKYPCAQVIFDSDPAPIGKNVPSQLEEMSQAMIRGVMDESGEQFVAYFLPTEATLEKRRKDFVENVLYKDDEEYEYNIAREYNWNVKSKASKGYEENYFFTIRHDGIYYNELETRVRLNKRRLKVGQQPSNTKLIVKHRPLDKNEHRMQHYREKLLEPPNDDDDDDDEEEEENEEIEETNKQQDDKTDDKKEGNEVSQPMDTSVAKETNEDNANISVQEAQIERDRESRSQRSSRSKSRSKTRSRSASRSVSKSPASAGSSRSRSKSASRSRSRSQTGSRSRSASKSSTRSGSASPARSKKSTSRSISRSPSGSRKSSSRSRSRSNSRTPRKSGSEYASASPANSVSDKSGSAGSRSPSRSRSVTPSGSGSGSGSGSSSAEEN